MDLLEFSMVFWCVEIPAQIAAQIPSQPYGGTKLQGAYLFSDVSYTFWMNRLIVIKR